jgi:hypothetical protein
MLRYAIGVSVPREPTTDGHEVMMLRIGKPGSTIPKVGTPKRVHFRVNFWPFTTGASDFFLFAFPQMAQAT